MNQQSCAKCHAQNAPEMSFCMNCGAGLTISGSAPPSAADLPPTVLGGAFPMAPSTVLAAPPKKSNAGKILLALAGGSLLLLLAAGVIGAAVFYFAFFEVSSERTEIDINVPDRNPAPLSDKNSNPAPNDSARTIDDFVRSQIGGYKVTNTTTGNPAADGFPGALEEKQYKYSNAGGTFSIHYTIDRYASPAQAQKALRDAMAGYNRKGIKTTEIAEVNDNDGKLVGLYADMFAKTSLMSRFWTKHEFYIRILGEKKDVDSFFAAH